ncbi:hypothetical protein, partial [Frankia tisae]|uniref:hypothetical protein n=2 Tax=Frankia tisae TaxID=2950104 RepID=UPI0021BFF90B
HDPPPHDSGPTGPKGSAEPPGSADVVVPADPIEPEDPGRAPDGAKGRRRRRLRYVIGAAVVACAVAVVAVLGAGVWRPGSSGTCRPPAPVMRLAAPETWAGSQDEQCIGFSDGAYTFASTSPDLVALLTTIGRQNAALAGKGGVHTVVVAAPLTGPHSPPGGGQADSPTTIGQGGLNELLGAQLAQAAVNTAADVPGSRSRTRIRLLVANVGWHSGGAVTVARRIDEAARADAGLAGVLGLFQSTAAAREAVAQLSGTTQLPIVSSTASADAFTQPVGPPGHTRRPYDWYFRVGATNRREAAVIAQAIPTIMKREGRGDEPVRPLIVSSGGAAPKSVGADHYSDNLAQDVGAELRRLPGAAPAVLVPFPDADQAATASAADGGPTVLGVLGHTLSERCTGPAPPNLLVYTGRTTSVNILLEALAGSACGRADPHLPIISGDDAMELETDPGEIAAGAMGDHTFYFADFGLAQPGDVEPFYLEQTRSGGATVPGQWAAQMRGTPQRLISGHTIVAFDAMSVLVGAISAADINTPPPGQLRANVKAVLDRTCGRNALAGANGYISFDRYGDSTSAPVVIRRFDPAGATVSTVSTGTAPDSLRRPSDTTSGCAVY